MTVLGSAACRGPVGPPGASGSPPDAGQNPAGVVDYGVLTPEELAVARITAEVSGVSIPADGRPVVNVKVTERHGSGVRGMTAAAVNWRFALLKLAQGANGSANDTWVNYLAANDRSVSTMESATGATLSDNADGTYTYRFTKVLTAGPAGAGTSYDATTPHRLVILLFGTGNPFSPVNLIKEFIPASGADVTGQNDKVDSAACLECHTQFRAIAGEQGQLGTGQFHGGVRFDIRTCVSCHNDQRRFAVASSGPDAPAINSDATWAGDLQIVNNEAVLNFPVYIHKIHMGERLTLKGGTYAGVERPFETTFPQDVRNCQKCHRAPAALAENWHNAPSRRACNACHDDISFVSPPPPGRRLHTGGAQPNDGNCLLCHSAGAPAGDIPTSHIPVSPPNANNIYLNPASGNSNTNAAWVAAAGAVPPDANVITYDVKSVSTWDDAGVTRPQVVFKLKLDGKDVVFQDPATSKEMIPDFAGSPSAFFAFAVPQDGKATPADFNAQGSAYIRNVWNGTGTCANAAATTTRTGAGTLTGPDATGYYTMRLTCVVIPANASMLTGGIGYTYALGAPQADPTLNFINHTQPLTQTNLPKYPYTPNPNGQAGTGGLIVPALDVWKVAEDKLPNGTPRFAQRRQIVATQKCAACHVSLGVGPDFHAGQRNDAASCNFCHRPNLTSSGWSANQKDFVHSIHGAEKRTVHFTWHERSPTEGFWNTTYPAVLNRCTMCHLEGTFDFSLPATQAAIPNMLPSTVGAGTYAAGSVHSPYVQEGVNYGPAFTFNALTGASTEAASTTLIVTPIAAACSACHDSPAAIDHMQTNGALFWEARSLLATRPLEQCLICHGPDRIAGISLVHTDKTP
ncbi:MAG: OmcA/MtrC family decaheme c-type cytochrome [Myxococcales bacterium]